MLLAIDTSTHQTGLALYDAEGPAAECLWRSGRNHTAQLLPQLDMLLRHTGVGREALTAVAVALGPGSWSGLRVGLSVAKALVLASGAALIGVGTLDVLAAQQARSAEPVYPLIRLGRDRFASARFEGGAAPARAEADRNVSLAELCAGIEGPARFCGDLDEAARAELARLLGPNAHFPTPAANLRRAAVLAELAWARHGVGAHDDPVALEPVYLGEPVKARS